MQTLLLIAVALFSGLLMTRLFDKFRMPDVTAYLVTGVLIGPCVLGRLGIPCLGFNTFEQVDSLSMISDVALGFIAFAIGHEFRLSALKQTGRQATVIGIIQACFATLCVDAALIALHFIMPDLLSGLVIFAISFGIAQSLKDGDTDIAALILEPLMEVFLSLAFGGLVGLALTWLERFFHSHRNRNALIVGSVILTVAVSQLKIQVGSFSFGFSSLLVCMMLGTVFCNFCPLSEDLMLQADRWSGPAVTLFFVLSGAALKFEVFGDPAVLLAGVVYIVARSLGKYLGAGLSSSMVRSPEPVRKYLGITLLPQAGVALGMCATAYRVLGGADGTLVRNIVLFSVLVYELVGPSLTKWALTRAGDIRNMPDEVAFRRTKEVQEAAKPVPAAFRK